MVRTAALAVALAAALGLGACGGAGKPATPPAPTITWVQYQAIKPGMTYDQVTALLHDKGEQKATPEVGGHVAHAYSFGAAGGDCVIVFDDQGKVIDKSTISIQAPALK